MAEEHNDLLAATSIAVDGLDPRVNDQLTPVEIILGESLLTPGLQTFIRVMNRTNILPGGKPKDLESFKNKNLNMTIIRPVLSRFGINNTMRLRQRIYKMSERKLMPKEVGPNVEEFVLHCCDPSLLEDAKSLVSKSWKCTTPSAVVSEVLQSCVGVSGSRLDVQSSDPARDYVAENIHPFQVVTQQANVALDGDDPSFVHWMTFGDVNNSAGESSGIHHFRSLKNLTKASPIIDFQYSEVADVYIDPHNILAHIFPCDFDVLSDVLNGMDENGKNITSAGIFSPLLAVYNLMGSQQTGCGIGRGLYKTSHTNQGAEKMKYACPDMSYQYIHKRQARMGLLEQDKIALRMTVPWNPELHAGKVVRAWFINKADPASQQFNYGTGDYLILAMKHHIKRGGYATTTLDCVSTSVGQGIQ